MTIPRIWTKGDEGWMLSQPEGFPDEATLHGLIEETPEMLPLAGAPRLLILGKEVLLGSGYADLIGVEATGRPVIIEIKLADNNEARRAVVAQILAYAASLHGMTREQLEDRFSEGLRRLGHSTLLDAVRSIQEEFDADGFTAAVDEHLQEGRFRLVFVLDAVPSELMTLVAYLEHVTDKLVIDLVAVNSFDVSGTSVMLPQRVTPERHEVTVEQTRRTESKAVYHVGSERFETSINGAPEESRDSLQRLLTWAREMEQQGLARLQTSEGIDGKRFVLRPLLRSEDVGLVSIWNEAGAWVQFWRSVFERRAPDFIERIEELTGERVGQGNWTQSVNDDLLETLAEAYEWAASKRT